MHTKLMRFALVADAIASGATGLLMAGAAGLLADLTGIPAGFSMPVGLALVGFAAFVGLVGTRPQISRGLTLLIVGVNAVWVVGSLGLIATGLFPLTALGIAFVLMQAAAVAALATTQEIALGKPRAEVTA